MQLHQCLACFLSSVEFCVCHLGFRSIPCVLCCVASDSWILTVLMNWIPIQNAWEQSAGVVGWATTLSWHILVCQCRNLQSHTWQTNWWLCRPKSTSFLQNSSWCFSWRNNVLLNFRECTKLWNLGKMPKLFFGNQKKKLVSPKVLLQSLQSVQILGIFHRGQCHKFKILEITTQFNPMLSLDSFATNHQNGSTPPWCGTS